MQGAGSMPGRGERRNALGFSALRFSSFSIGRWRQLWFRRMRPHEFLVDVGAPARPLREYEVAVLDDGWHGDDVVLPGYVVDVDLHDFEVGRHGAHMRADQ